MDSQSSNVDTQAGALNAGNVVIDVKPVQVSTEADNAAEMQTSEVAPAVQQAPKSTEKLGTNTTWLVLHWNYVVLKGFYTLSYTELLCFAYLDLYKYKNSNSHPLKTFATKKLSLNWVYSIVADVISCFISIPTYTANGFAYKGAENLAMKNNHSYKILLDYRLISICFFCVLLVLVLPLLAGSKRFKRGKILGAMNAFMIPMLLWYGWITIRFILERIGYISVLSIALMAFDVVVTGTSCVGLFMNGRPAAAKLLPYYYVQEPESTAA